jgi:hypothetical protein
MNRLSRLVKRLRRQPARFPRKPVEPLRSTIYDPAFARMSFRPGERFDPLATTLDKEN